MRVGIHKYAMFKWDIKRTYSKLREIFPFLCVSVFQVTLKSDKEQIITSCMSRYDCSMHSSSTKLLKVRTAVAAESIGAKVFE